MIYFLVHSKQSWPITTFVDFFAPRLASTVRVLPYELIPRRTRLPRGAYIFADLERLSPARLQLAGFIHQRVREAGLPALNDPRRAMRRYDLLRSLHEKGTNDFNVYRLSEGMTPARFPVFVRREYDHSGSLTPLLHDSGELARSIQRLTAGGARPEELLVVEYCDTSDAGLFRKYSAFRIGRRVFASHVLTDRVWMTKETPVTTPEIVAAENIYLRTNPHEQQLSNIFEHAGIGYGRVDYGLRAGRVQVWEINTNPVVMPRKWAYEPLRWPGQEFVGRKIIAAFEAIDTFQGAGSIRIRLDRDLARRCAPDSTEKAWIYAAPLRRSVFHEVTIRDALRITAAAVRRRASALFQAAGDSNGRS